MILTIIRIALTVIVAVGIVVGVSLRFDTVFKGAGPTAGKPQETEDRALFRALVRHRVVRPRPDGSLDLMAPDYFLVRRAKGIGGKTTAAQRRQINEQRRLHGILYFAPVGGLIREQVRLWNDTRYVAAIRDDRTRAPGDFTNEWRIFSAKGHPLRTSDLVPESFGFVLDGQLRPGYSDWSAVSRRGGRVTFKTSVRARRATTLLVQVIGKPVSWTPSSGKVTQLTGAAQFGCGAPTGALLRFTLPASQRRQTISVTAEPSVSCERSINGLAIRMAADAVGKYTQFDWRPIKRASSAASKFVITTADGVLLTRPDGSGKPTRAAYQLGLVPIVGFGPAATLSLSGIMAGTKLPPRGVTVALTIDSRVQKAAQAAILKQIKKMRGVRGAKMRKAAVVVLDAETGAILAVGNYPTVPSGARPWDYAAFGAAFPLRDPSTVIGWGIIDRNNTPGSTFKPLVALSVMHAAKPDELSRFRRIMQGLNPTEIGPLMGLQAGQSAYAPNGAGGSSISNFGNGGLGPFAGRALRNGACVKKPPVSTTFGLRQAVQLSINVWFARLSVMLDEQRVQRLVGELVKQKNRPYKALQKPSRLIEAIRWIGIHDTERMDLASNLPASIQLRRFNAGNSADVLYPQVARQAFLNVPLNPVPGAVSTLRHIAALNGIGQSVSVHPLHMARGAAAIASGKLVEPHIFQSWGGQPLAPPGARPLNVEAELLQALREGMKAVPEAGTAYGKFPGKLQCRTYGKTGTAEIIKQTGQHSAWFIGWREPKNPPQLRKRTNPADRRFAFACMVTHGFGGFRTGGSSCAPVVSDILQAVEAEEKPKKKKKPKARRAKKRAN